MTTKDAEDRGWEAVTRTHHPQWAYHVFVVLNSVSTAGHCGIRRGVFHAKQSTQSNNRDKKKGVKEMLAVYKFYVSSGQLCLVPYTHIHNGLLGPSRMKMSSQVVELASQSVADSQKHSQAAHKHTHTHKTRAHTLSFQTESPALLVTKQCLAFHLRVIAHWEEKE